ncbi:hypothetical protein PL11201_130016 [Planktothrix sp. PCC 11201]|nr:hypothetical protein PL11201_130016 [Planktothrix sp. PCC 11201]
MGLGGFIIISCWKWILVRNPPLRGWDTLGLVGILFCLRGDRIRNIWGWARVYNDQLLETDISMEPAPTGLEYIRICGNSVPSRRGLNQKPLEGWRVHL